MLGTRTIATPSVEWWFCCTLAATATNSAVRRDDIVCTRLVRLTPSHIHNKRPVPWEQIHAHTWLCVLHERCCGDGAMIIQLVMGKSYEHNVNESGRINAHCTFGLIFCFSLVLFDGGNWVNVPLHRLFWNLEREIVAVEFDCHIGKWLWHSMCVVQIFACWSGQLHVSQNNFSIRWKFFTLELWIFDTAELNR